MTKRFNPPSAQRLSAIAIAAALAAFAGVATAQSARTAPAAPGFVVNSSGVPVRSAQGDCVRPGQTAAAPGIPCPTTTSAAASASPTRVAAADSPRGGTAASSAAAGSTAAGAPSKLPGYAQASDGRVVLSGFGQCVRAGHWAPGNAAEPCDRIAVAQVEPPPAPVAAAPEPKIEPAPAPLAQPAPAPAPVAQPEPPRPVIQKITLSSDVLFEFDKATLRETGKQKLDEIVAATKDARVEEVLAIGYADPIGSEQYNEKLSAERAAAVREYLVQNGVQPDRIKSEGRGETREFSAGSCAKLTGKKLIDCFEPNRRVDVELLGSREVAAGSPPAAGAGTTGTTGSGSGTTGSGSSGSSGSGTGSSVR